jgi:hypothetical protein
MPRPQPAPSASLRRNRPEDHVFEPVGTPAPDAPAETDGNAASRIAAVAASRNGGDAADRNAAEPPETLVKFSIRVPPAAHRHIKVTAAQNGMTIQDLAVTAIGEYLDRLGHPLP